MKQKFSLLILMITFFALFLPLGVTHAATNNEDKVVLGNNFTLSNGETLNGDLAVIGGTALLEPESTVIGDVVVAGGTLTAKGLIKGNLAAFGGSIILEDSAVVQGNLNLLGGSLQKSPGARIEGDIINGGESPFQFTIPDVPTPNRIPEIRIQTSPFWQFFLTIFRIFGWALGLGFLAVLLGMFLAKPIDRIADTIMVAPVISGGLGLLTIVALVPVLIIMTITLILIPITPLVGLLVVIAAALGWIALGYEVGKRLVALFKTEWPLPASAGLGTFFLTLVLFTIGLVPCIGPLVPILFSMIGLGAVILSRFGSQVYQSAGNAVNVTPLEVTPPKAPTPPPAE